ncbi:hypothetical protein LBMAG42_02610 [Deltaproteobacteria bacterium]|nr:hypothetical protein LBMAG42_02610 [Deltaproteobacteria bacterium]
MDSRRDFLRYAMFGVALVAAPGSAFAAGALHPAFLFHPLGPGADLGLGWRLERVFPPFEGAITLNLVNADGRLARVDVCLREGAALLDGGSTLVAALLDGGSTLVAAKGPAHTALLDFIVMDGGDGTAPMDESLGRVVRRLAAIAADNEGTEMDRLAQLAPHAARVWSHPESMAAASARLSPGAPAA